MNTKVKITSLIIALSASVLSFNASADDKVFPGSMCQPLHGSQAADFYTSTTGGIINAPFSQTDTTTRWVTCPIVRDNTGNTNGTPFVYVNVKRSNRTTKQLRCTIMSSNTNGSNTVDTNTATYTGTGHAWLNLTIQTSAVWGTYAFACLLPAGSSIPSYILREF